MHNQPLYRRDVVEVRSPGEILATLDEQGMLGGVPFMPEMLRHCGRQFVVDKRTGKICDTMYVAGSRRLPGTVLLEDLRCDGSAHDGCQAECRIFWKEEWLRKVDAGEPASASQDESASAALKQVAERNAKQVDHSNPQRPPIYRCQATEHYRASQRLRTWDPRPYLREYTSGNVGLWHFLRVFTRAAVVETLRRLRLWDQAPVKGTPIQERPYPPLGLQPGDLVRVKTPAEVAETLTLEGTHRGIWFDRENVPFCGRTMRVRQRVSRLIDEHNGQMIEPNDWLTLEDSVCSGDYSWGRWFCPRNFYLQWNEAWLERVDDAPGSGAHPASHA